MIEIGIVIAIISVGLFAAFHLGRVDGRRREQQSNAPLEVQPADMRVVARRLNIIADEADKVAALGDPYKLSLDVMEMFRIAQAVRMASQKKPCKEDD